jgi:HAD superfamily hydrolase (TIGR01490 family)
VSRLKLRSRETREVRAVLAGTAAAAAAEVESALAVPEDRTAGAFFDVDNTIVAGASIYHFARGLAARDFITTRDIVDFAWQQVKFRVGGKESHEGMAAARERGLSFVAGKRVDEIVRLGEEIYDELMAERIWAGTQALAQLHLDAGQRVWLVTATPVELASIIARRLGLTGALGTVAEVVDGEYTGRLMGEPLHGPGRPGGSGPRPVRRLQRLRQRPADAAGGRPGGRGEPGLGAADRGAGPGLGGARLPYRPEGGEGRGAGRARGRRGRRRGRGRRQAPAQARFLTGGPRHPGPGARTGAG